MRAKKLLIVEIAALGWELVQRHVPMLSSWNFQRADPVFPATTCPVQASFRTASPPSRHGMVSNGVFLRDLRKAMFWEQSAALVEGDRIWKSFRERGKRVGMMFWQQSLGENVDLLLSPAPIHKHSGGMIQDCHSEPRDLYARLTVEIGRPFNLIHYWGPLASRKSSDWIVDATKAVMSMPGLAPDLLLSYLPHLDYDLQRHGPESPQALDALRVLHEYLQQLRTHAEKNGYEFLFFGDYAIESASPDGAIFPNRILRDARLFTPRIVKGRAYADLFTSPAFAMVDHQVAHVFARDESTIHRARHVFEKIKGVEKILDHSAQKTAGTDHTRSGDLILVAGKGHWFAYPWWSDRKEAPDYARHVDIHNKPGYDPCELFFGWPPLSVSQDTRRIRGTHGRTGEGCATTWTSSCDFKTKPQSLIELAQATQEWLSARNSLVL